MNEHETKYLPIIAYGDDENVQQEMGILSSAAKKLIGTMKNVDQKVFTESLSDVVKKLSLSIESINSNLDGFELDEIEFKLDVTVQGQIGIIAAGGTGVISLKFKKKC